MKRTTTMLAGLGAAGALFLAGCGGSDTAAPSTSATQAPATSSAAASSTSASSSAAAITTPSSLPSSSMAASSDASMSMASPTGTTTVGGDATSLDAQSTTWFDTMCTGLAPLADLAANPPQVTDPAQAGPIFTQIGDSMTATGTQLAATPPPTFEGGDALATQVVDGLAKVGPAFSEFGTKAATLDKNDPAAIQQFGAELQSVFGEAGGLLQIDLTPELKTAVAAVPSCTPLFQQS